ncbi:MAG: MFS transporter [Ruminococcaceae bacterium]|nr:MFS transporter [Oscillospiraceae bacterium]
MQKKYSLLVHTLGHFCVDFCCFFLLFAGFKNAERSASEITIGFLCYNIIAFGLQPIIGCFCDNHKKFPISLIGCTLLFLAIIFFRKGWVPMIIAALGNACFHVGGGIESLVNANGKMARSGVFVSSGALGVSLGTFAGISPSFPVIIPIMMLSVCILLLLTVFPGQLVFKSVDNPKPVRLYIASTTQPIIFMLLLLFFSVFIRAYAGSILPIKWKNGIFLSLLPSIAAFSGKFFGGFFADRFGAKNTGVATLLLSVPLLLFGIGSPILTSVGLLLFNMNMSITLCAVYSLLPDNPGLSFGIPTLALLCGGALTFFFSLSSTVSLYLVSFLTISSAIGLIFSTVNQSTIAGSHSN